LLIAPLGHPQTTWPSKTDTYVQSPTLSLLAKLVSYTKLFYAYKKIRKSLKWLKFFYRFVDSVLAIFIPTANDIPEKVQVKHFLGS
jgi:hypothetical protein